MDEPRWNFRRFVLGLADKARALAPKDLIKRYEAYDREHRGACAAKFFEAHRASGLIRDKFHEESVLQTERFLMQQIQDAKAAFFSKLKAGDFKDFSLTVPAESLKALEPVSLGAGLQMGVLDEKSTLLHSANAVLLFPGIPPSVSVWDLRAALQAPGLLEVSLQSPEPGQLLRTGLARFAEMKDLEASMAKFKGFTVSGFKLQPKKADERVLVTPPADGDRRAIDAALAEKVLRAIEVARGVPAEETAETVTELASLELLVLYLRKVHCCCYYGTTWCDSAAELTRSCGLIGVSASDLEGDSQAWAADHDRRVTDLLRRVELVALRKPPSSLGLDVEPLSSRWNQRWQEVMLQESEGRFRCKECKKLFKGPDYVKRHVLKDHSVILNSLIEQIQEERMRELFFGDAQAVRHAQVALFAKI